VASIAERVAAGAAWLDERKPGWERKIDLAALQIKLPCRCVLGQVFAGGREWGRNGWGYARREWPEANPAALGFAAVDADYPALDEAWITLLKERFSSGALSDAES